MGPLSLTLVVFLPIAGAVLIWLLPSPNPQAGPVGVEPGSHAAPGPRAPNGPRWVAALVSGLTLVLAVALFVRYYSGGLTGYHFATNVPWIGLLGVNYHVAVDGISLPLV